MPSQQEFVKAYAEGLWSYELSEKYCSRNNCPLLDIHRVYAARGLRPRREYRVPYGGRSNEEDKEWTSGILGTMTLQSSTPETQSNNKPLMIIAIHNCPICKCTPAWRDFRR